MNIRKSIFYLPPYLLSMLMSVILISIVCAQKRTQLEKVTPEEAVKAVLSSWDPGPESKRYIYDLKERGVEIMIDMLPSLAEPSYKTNAIGLTVKSIKINGLEKKPKLYEKAVTAITEEVSGFTDQRLKNNLYGLRGLDHPKILKLAQSQLNNPDPDIAKAAEALVKSISTKDKEKPNAQNDSSIKDEGQTKQAEPANKDDKKISPASEGESKPAIPLWVMILGGIGLLGIIITAVKRK